jgi:hypothetical protein
MPAGPLRCSTPSPPEPRRQNSCRSRIHSQPARRSVHVCAVIRVATRALRLRCVRSCIGVACDFERTCRSESRDESCGRMLSSRALASPCSSMDASGMPAQSMATSLERTPNTGDQSLLATSLATERLIVRFRLRGGACCALGSTSRLRASPTAWEPCLSPRRSGHAASRRRDVAPSRSSSAAICSAILCPSSGGTALPSWSC